MNTRILSLVALLATCSTVAAQQPVASSPSPYAGGRGVLWSQTFRQANATAARLSLSIHLGAGDVLSLKDGSGAVQWTYHGKGPISSTATTSSVDLAGVPPMQAFLSGSVSGDTVTVELAGRSGGQGVTVHAVHWQSGPILAAATAGRCDLSEVAPEGFANVEGNSNTSYPWNTTSAMRVMYSYGRESVDLDRPVRICGVRYRPDGGTATTFATDYDFRLDVSTSRNPALGLDHTFDNNHGVDRTTVFDGVMNMAAVSGLGTVPNPFLLEVTFDTPFEWDPRSGPLLLDFQHRGATNSPGASWDAGSGFADSGRIAALSNGASAAVATFPGGSGTQAASMVVELCLETDIAPSTVTTTEGGSSSSYPFSRPSPMRVMYAYDDSIVDFEGRHKISALSFRTNNAAAFAGASYDMRISMSTSVNPANALQPTFDANHGNDKAVVFEGIHVAAPAAAGGTAPGRFVLTIPLDTPFDYNPANGPLLIDFQLMAGVTSTVPWDGVFGPEPAYRIFNTISATAATGSVQQFGLAVALHAEPTPTIPEVDDSTAGSSSSSFPWNSTPQRAMYQYAPSLIATDRPLYIQHLSWRPRGVTVVGPVSYTCTIDLSTSAVAMSPAFNSNHGSDRARVFDGTFSVPYQDTYSDPSEFPISVKLDQPFYYDPANGPLIVDIRMLDTNGFTSSADGSFVAGLARVVNTVDPNSNIANFPSSGLPQGFGLDLRLSGEGCNATSVNYGLACTGSNGPAACVNHGLATLPSPDFGIGLRGGPTNSVGFLVIGVTQTSIPLAIIGAPGCLSLTPGEIGAFGVPTSASGSADYALPLPGDGSFSGFQFMTQWVSLDLGFNQLGLTYSNAQLHTTCY